MDFHQNNHFSHSNMKTLSNKIYILTAALFASAASMTAQELKSAFFTEDFMYRHTMDPSIGNDQNYVAIPILGNINTNLQGSLGVGDFFFKNPDFGKVAGAKKTATFMHPGLTDAEALKGFKEGANTLLFDNDLNIISIGFKSFNGYNTIELKERTHFGVSLPYDFFKFARNIRNENYQFGDLGVRGWSYAELAFGHSRLLFNNLRIGAKVKFLFGGAYANVSAEGLHANLQGDQWELAGKVRGELSMKGASFKSKIAEYKSRFTNNVDAEGNKIPQKYQKFDGIDVNGPGLGGFGLGLDLGASFELSEFPVDELNGLKLSVALTDLGFISWKNNVVAESSGQPFIFNGFRDFSVKEESGQTVGNMVDSYGDQLKDFINLENKGDEGGKTRGLASTLRVGLEYPLPVYDKIQFGFLFTRRFDSQYSWSDSRISANYTPLKWLDGGINIAFSSFCTSMGWIINFHPNGFNFFVGMDHMIGKTGAKMVPLNSNFSFNVGMNIAWGGKKKSSKELKTLRFCKRPDIQDEPKPADDKAEKKDGQKSTQSAPADQKAKQN